MATPNETTRKTMDATDAGRDVIVCKDGGEMFRKLRIGSRMKSSRRVHRVIVGLAILVLLAFLAYPYFRVWWLNQLAQMSNRGQLGCLGGGRVKLHTTYGVVSIPAGDQFHVFGDDIYVSELVGLVEARSRCNGEGFSPTAGNVSDLYYVILDTLADSKDPTVIQPVSGLLDDPDPEISRWSAIALIRLGEQSADFRERIASMYFPPEALRGALGHDEKIPAWLAPKVEAK